MKKLIEREGEVVVTEQGTPKYRLIHEPKSSAMSAWRARTKGALPVTLHGRLEIINGICLASFRKMIGAEAKGDALASFDEDLAEGRYVDADVLWRATLNAPLTAARSPR